MNKVIIKGLRIFGKHGVMPQERTVGTYFTIDIALTTDFSHAMRTDELDGTISYAEVHEVVKREMAVPSQLLEHVAGRIANALFEAFPGKVEKIHLRILKENPPMGADCEGAGVEIEALPPAPPHNGRGV